MSPSLEISIYAQVYGSPWAWRSDMLFDARVISILGFRFRWPRRKRHVMEVDRGMISFDGIHWYGSAGNSWMILSLGAKPDDLSEMRS